MNHRHPYDRADHVFAVLDRMGKWFLVTAAVVFAYYIIRAVIDFPNWKWMVQP